MTKTTSWASGKAARGLTVVLGVWLFISAFLWSHEPAARTDTWILGIVIAVFALAAMSAPALRWVDTIAAIWLFIAAVWALPHGNVGTQWNNAIVAIVVFLASLVPGGAGTEPQLAAHHAT